VVLEVQCLLVDLVVPVVLVDQSHLEDLVDLVDQQHLEDLVVLVDL
jgi:hypothetical protein